MIRLAYAHDAVVVMSDGGDPRAPGGAIARALCGSWDHRPPCPLAPHRVTQTVDGEALGLRVLFATRAVDEARVRRLIDEALEAGELTGPDGRTSTWRLASSAAGDIGPDEQSLAVQLVAHR